MNSVVRPIFNEKVDKKWRLWDPWTGQPLRLKKKKKKKKNGGNTNTALVIQNFLKFFLMIYYDWCIIKVISMINNESNIALFITSHKRKSCQIYCIPN